MFHQLGADEIPYHTIPCRAMLYIMNEALRTRVKGVERKKKQARLIDRLIDAKGQTSPGPIIDAWRFGEYS